MAESSIPSPQVKPKLLVVELWGLGDLVIATPFLRAASQLFHVTLLAKPYARELQLRFWPEVKIVPFTAPWTAFKHKYYLFSWPWREIFALRKLRAQRFEFGLSARWDPRDHFLLKWAAAKHRFGFPRLGSANFLTHPLAKPHPTAHRYEHWRILAKALDFQVPVREKLLPLPPRAEGEILIHTGAGQPVRVWPLDRYQRLVARLRERHYRVQVACDPEQQEWWLRAGETRLAVPRTVSELLTLVDRAGAFIGNDSGPGHLAACCGVPTFTLFGPQLAEWFAPLHPLSEWIEGKPCPYKPCSDYCRFPVAHCLADTTDEEVWLRVISFLSKPASRLQDQPAALARPLST